MYTFWLLLLSLANSSIIERGRDLYSLEEESIVCYLCHKLSILRCTSWPIQGAPGMAASLTPEKVQKGLSDDDIACLVTTFPLYNKDEKKTSRTRVKGKRLPKGAATSGILSQDEANECSICLEDFQYGQKMGLLPCCHRFHAHCVNDWLKVIHYIW